MGVAMMNEPKQSIAGKRLSSRSSSNTGQTTTEWPISDVTSDLTVEVGTTSFALHKFPLISRSGRIRRLLSDSKESSRIILQSVAGGPQAFEVAAKFCYGVNNTEIITLSNIATLRCVADYLEMTDEYAEKNLITRTEFYLKETVLPNITNSISVLHQCEALLPVAEDINLVNRLITSIASNACKEQLSSGLSKLEQKFPTIAETETLMDWWGKSLVVLSLGFFQRVISAMRLMGLKQDIISRILINYAQTFLQSLVVRDPQMLTGECVNLELQKKQRVIVEAVVTLLPTSSRKSSSSVPMAFLSSLLKTSMACSASSSCKADMEKRIASRLDQAILEDILIPTATTSHGNNNINCSSSSSLYETDMILRIFSIFLKLEEEDDDDDEDDNHFLSYDDQVLSYDFVSSFSRKQNSIVKVSKLLDSYLAEVALDSNMTPSKFIRLAEILPDDHARVVTDGLYKAVDIFLKVHPNMKDTERNQLCKTIDCQKLSQEACSHAAQNERLPVQMAVQVLYFEQTRLRTAMNSAHSHHNSQFLFGSLNGGQRSGGGSGTASPRDNYASVRRENRELRLEVARMRMRLTDLEKDHVSMKQEFVGGGGGSNGHTGNKMFRSLTKKLGKLNSLFFFWGNGMKIKRKGSRFGSESRFFFQKQRHHSIS